MKKGLKKMIQLMTFLIAQLMFVPVYLKVTDTCTENKGTFWQKIKIISISPFAVYLYVNIFFAFCHGIYSGTDS